MSVVVVGGGAAGLLCSAALARSGFEVFLLEASPFGGTQTSACHGYLHLGYAYGDAEPGLCDALAAAQPYWHTFLRGLDAVMPESSILFTGRDAGQAAMAAWERRRLPVVRVQPPPWIAECVAHCFGTAERTYDMHEVIARLIGLCAASGVRMVSGVRVTSLRESGGQVHIAVESSGENDVPADVPAAAEAVVITAGAGSRDLAPAYRRDTMVNRLAHVLVLEGALPITSAVFPEPARHGLFITSRRGHRGGENAWIVSTFHSFDEMSGDCQELLAWWIQHVLQLLGDIAGEWLYDAVRQIGAYRTVKSGLAPTAGTVAAAGVSRSRRDRVIAAVPSKLTLAPLVAEEAAVAVHQVLGHPCEAGLLLGAAAAGAAGGGPPARLAERWRSGPMLPFDEAFRPGPAGRFQAELAAIGARG